MDRFTSPQISRLETRKKESQEVSRTRQALKSLGVGLLIGGSLAQSVGGLPVPERADSSLRLAENNNLTSRNSSWLNESSLVSSDTTTNHTSREFLRSVGKKPERFYQEASQRTSGGEISQRTTDKLSSSRKTLRASNPSKQISDRETSQSFTKRSGHDKDILTTLSAHQNPESTEKSLTLASKTQRASDLRKQISDRETSQSFTKGFGHDAEPSQRGALPHLSESTGSTSNSKSYRDIEQKEFPPLRGGNIEFSRPVASNVERLLQTEEFQKDILTTLTACQENSKFAENIITLAKRQGAIDNINSMTKNKYLMQYICDQSQNPKFAESIVALATDKKLVDSVRSLFNAEEVEGLTRNLEATREKAHGHNLDTNIEMSPRPMRKLLSVEATRARRSTNLQDTGNSKEILDQLVVQSVGNNLGRENVFVYTSLALVAGSIGFLLYERGKLNSVIDKRDKEIKDLRETNQNLNRDKEDLTKQVQELTQAKETYIRAIEGLAPHLRPYMPPGR